MTCAGWRPWGVGKITGAVCLLSMALLIWCPDAYAEGYYHEDLDDEQFEEVQREFRQKILEEWNWQPERGVKLTTTEWARDYLAGYFDEEGTWSGKEPDDQSLVVHLPSGRDRTPIVLFQTETVDLLAMDGESFTHSFEPGFAVIDRSERRVLEYSRYRFTTMGSLKPLNIEFVDLDGRPPLEFRWFYNIRSGTEWAVRYFRVYDLFEDFEQLLELKDFHDDDKYCPRLQSKFEDEELPEIKRTEDGRGYFRVEVWKQLYLYEARKDRPSPNPIEPPPRVLRTCVFEADARELVCDDEFLETRDLTFEEIAGGEREGRAPIGPNLRYVLKETENLRRWGYRFPNDVLERLPPFVAEDEYEALIGGDDLEPRPAPSDGACDIGGVERQ